MIPPCKRKLAVAAIAIAAAAVLQYIEQITNPQPYHDSILTGEKWLQELLLTCNNFRFYEQLGVNKEPFLDLVKELEELYLIKQMRHMSTEEQVAIFLYSVVTNVSNRKVAKRFQRSGETVSRYVLNYCFFV
jgi:hypothetical protein